MDVDGSELAGPGVLWGSELKHYRERAELSQQELANQINWARSTVQAVEAGTRKPPPNFAEACDALFDTGGALVRLRKKMFLRAAFWSSFRPWPDLEQEATVLRGYESVMVPGLLQTPEFARIVLRMQNEEVVAGRLERQQIFAKPNPPSVRFVIDEWVLRRPVGPPQVMVDQLRHLEHMIETESISLQVSPSGSVPGAHGSFLLARLNGETIGFEESTTQGMLVSEEDGLMAMESMYDEVIAEALPSGASLETVRRIRDQWQQTCDGSGPAAAEAAAMAEATASKSPT